ncbi:DUF6976 family protein [Pelomonas baiyunensis]|uniref:DUF6976 family protein n=1 Tax=Pelomonas baiyunensis TaxID=3299026 RepID=A0ABW7GWY9_9BURK
MHQLMTIDAVVRLLRNGRPLAVTGAEAALDQLPVGPWVGATTSPVRSPQGEVRTDRQVWVTELPARGLTTLHHVAADAMHEVWTQGPEQGYSLALLPEGGVAHVCCTQPDLAGAGQPQSPVVTWLARVEAGRPGQHPLIYFGKTGQKLSDGAVVAHVRLPNGQSPAEALAGLIAPEGVQVLGLAPGMASAPVGLRQPSEATVGAALLAA